MKRIAALFVALLVAAPAFAADKLPLSAISTYLNGLTTAQANFVQYNDDGSRSTGTLWIHRPGRMRFEYAPPNSAVVIAGGNAVLVHDPKSNQPPETYPLKRTPLSVILARRVDLGRAGMVVGHGHDGTYTVVRAQDPENPEYGFIDLKFAANPVRLERWTIQDGSGTRTTVVLGKMATGMKLGASLFSTQGGGGRPNR